MIVRQPLETINMSTDFDIKVSVEGGGMSGQAGAIRSQSINITDVSFGDTAR